MSVTMLRSPRHGIEVSQSPRATLWQARIVCLSVFGPYIAGSARTEQIAVFASFGLILLFGWPKIITVRSIPPMSFLVTWLSLDAIMLIGTVWRPFDPAFYGAQPASHALAAYLLPVALMTLTWFWTLSADGPGLVRAVAPVIVGAMSVNTVISLIQAATRNAAVFSVLPRFWDAPGSLGSVAANAAGNGRFTGIFDQPAEAGVAYGVALFCLIYLAQQHAIKTRLTALCAAALITGGTLTVSKIFLMLAIPLAAMMVLRTPGSRVRVILCVMGTASTLWLLAAAHSLPSWPGGSRMLRALLHPPGSLTAEYTAGRYSTGSRLGPVVGDVLHASPWSGFGAGGLETAYDSLWVQVLVLAGIFGVILAGAIVIMLVARWLRLRGSLERREWNLAGATLVLAIGASLGLPSLTANRACTLLWLILGVLLTGCQPLTGSPREDVPA